MGDKDEVRDQFKSAGEPKRDENALPDPVRQRIREIRDQGAKQRESIQENQKWRDAEAVKSARLSVLKERLNLELKPRHARGLRLTYDAMEKRARAIVDRANETELQRHDDETERAVDAVCRGAEAELSRSVEPGTSLVETLEPQNEQKETGREELLRLFEESSRDGPSNGIEH